MDWKLIVGVLFVLAGLRALFVEPDVAIALLTLIIGIFILNSKYKFVQSLMKRSRSTKAKKSNSSDSSESDEGLSDWAKEAAAKLEAGWAAEGEERSDTDDGYEFDSEKYPDGISEDIDGLNSDVWDRGYYLCPEEGGTWYELYVTESVKESYPDVSEELAGFKGLYLGNYEEYNQITFFEPDSEDQYTLDEMTDIFA
ncbi:MAG: DUF308 domain-containing protein [Betaproteobacteria bacterium]